MTTHVRQIDYSKRVLGLDILRGIAVLLVVPHHSLEFSHDLGDLGILSFIPFLITRFGWTGVDLFFVLSGFLIGGVVFREIVKSGRFNALRFLTRRAFKIWPPYFALLVWAIANATRHGVRWYSIWQLYWPNFVHLQNYFVGARDHLWSLAVEEHFYICLAMVLMFLSAYRLQWVARNFSAAAICAIIVVSLLRLVETLCTKKYTWQTLYTPTHDRVDSLLFGVLLAHTATFRPPIWRSLVSHPWAFLFAGICLIVPVGFNERMSFFCYTVGYSLLYVGYGAVLVATLGFQTRLVSRTLGLPGSLLRNLARCVASIGVYSYGIYLWHIDFAQQPIWFHLLPHLRHYPAKLSYCLLLSAYMSLAIVTGAIMTILVEFPALKLRELLIPRVTNSSFRGDLP